MLIYFLFFALMGYFIGRLLTRDNGVVLIVVLAVIWGISSAPVWGLASLGEMFLGFYIAQVSSKKNED